MQAFPSEIQAEDIHDNLARRTAARHKLAAAVALCATTLRAPSKMTKFWPTWDKSAVLPACAVKFAIPKRPPKDGRVNKLPRKLLHHDLPHQQHCPVRNRLRLLKNPPYISRPAAPNATVVEPPAVPVVPMAKTDIPEPPVFQTSIAPIDIPEPPTFEHKIQVPIFDAQVNAHVSNQPERSIRDYLISESAVEEVEFDGEPEAPVQPEEEAIQTVETIEPIESVETIARPSEYTQTVIETPVQTVEPSVQESTPSIAIPTSATLTDAASTDHCPAPAAAV